MSRGPIPDKPAERPTVPEVAKLLKAYYAKPGNAVGGSLHAVLDDGNLEDGSIESCRQWAAERGDEDGVRLADLLLQMTGTQRRNVAARSYYA